MIALRPGSHTHNLITILSVTGEFPVRSLPLLGNPRVVRLQVHKLESAQSYRTEDGEKVFRGKLLQLSGKGAGKTVRFFRPGVEILPHLYDGAYEYYMNAYDGHRFSGEAIRIDRHHRVAEAVAMMMRAGIEFRPYLLPSLQKAERQRIVAEGCTFYLARSLKNASAVTEEINKTMFSRIVGAAFFHNEVYAVYNTRNALMKWVGRSEYKVLLDLTELSRMNALIENVNSAILFGKDYDIAIRSIAVMEKKEQLHFRFNSVYSHIHFIPLDEFGIRFLKLMTLPDWKSRLREVMFGVDCSSGYLPVDCDAYLNDTYMFSHLDGDLTRLVNIMDPIEAEPWRYEVFCFPEQLSLVRSVLSKEVRIKLISMDDVEQALLEGDDAYE
ncbi:MAG: hypothetical protein MJ077_03580 [Oscillospiraceae bacterium]|nr:hypothetical protein [Oscillospiraceae bacterium]